MAHANKNADRERTNTDTVTLFPSETLTLNSCHSLDYARGNESIIYFTNLSKPIEKTYIYAKKKHSFVSYPAAKHPNAANFRLQTYDKNQWTFLCNTGVNFSSRNKSANFKVSLQNFPFLFNL